MRTLLFLRRDPRTFHELARRHGDVVHFRIGAREIFLVSDPRLIEQLFRDQYAFFEKDWGPRRGASGMGNGLLTSEGAEHRAQRQQIAPLFSRANIEARKPLVREIVEAWSARRYDGESLELAAEMAVLGTRIAARVLFGSTSADPAKINDAVATIGLGFRRFMFPYAHRLRRRVPRAAQLQEVMAELRRGHEPDALLAPLLGSDDQLGTFLITGTETIRLATSWAWFLLSGHPAEAGRLVHDDGTFAEAVLMESMRLYPPQWMIGRRVMTPYELDGRELPAGALLLMSPYVVQRDGRWFVAPERFDPDRWLRDPRPAHRYAYFPFGGGARRCIGEAFALATGTTILSLIARRWRFECDRAVSIDARLTLHPRSLRARVRAV